MTIELKNVTKHIGAEVHIYDTSIRFAETGFNVLLGETRAGKTTLIKLIAGLERPTSGEIWIKDRNVTGLSPQKRNVSLVHQFFVNYPNMTVFENIASPLRVAGVGKKERQRRVEEAAELMRLTPMLKRRPSELSGGQQQRTALARAIVKDSDVVLFDEPLANLDYKLREELRDELPRLLAGRGAIVVYATSEPHEGLLLGGHTAAMKDGRITQFGETSTVFRKPNDLDTARVFSDPPINAASVTKLGSEIRLDGSRWSAPSSLASAPDGEYTLGLHPHIVTPVRESADAVQVQGKIVVTELSGFESIAHFRRGNEDWVSQAQGVHAFEVGETHDFYFDPSRGLYFGADGRLVA